MAFVAEFDGATVDLTVPDDALWASIHRAGVGERLVCPECRGQVYAKRMVSTGTRFVSHAVGSSTCALAGESVEHRMLKLLCVQTLRRLGWDAQPEVPGDGWRADVLAFDPADPERTIVFEVQLSNQHNDETERRQRVLSAAGHEVVWLTRRITTWFRRAPTWCVETHDFRVAQVSDGVWRWCEDNLRFEQRPRALFDDVLSELLDGDLLWVDDVRTAGPGDRARLRGGKWPEWRGSGGWLSQSAVAAAAAERERLERMRREHERRASERQHTARRATRSATLTATRRMPTPTNGPIVAGNDVRDSGDIERGRRRVDAVARIVSVCIDQGWVVEERASSVGSYSGAVLVIEGRLVVVEPTGVRSGTWPGAVVIGNPVMAERKHVTDLTVVTVDDWTALPLLGSGDPDDVRRLEGFYNRPLPSGEEQLRLL